MARNSAFVAATLSLFLLHNLCIAVEFDRKTTGVVFSVYVKNVEGNAATGESVIPDWKSYSFDDVIRMMEVIHTRFSKVLTFGAGADNVPYVEHKTYFESNNIVWAAEAAAVVNKGNGNRSLTVIQGVWLTDLQQQMTTEMRLALECIKRANTTYPGTVNALLINNNQMSSDIKYATLALEQLRNVKREVKASGLKIGTQQSCKGIAEEPDNFKRELTMIRREILNESDFIVCEILPASHNLPSGPENAFNEVGIDLLGFRNEFRKVNPRIEVMGQTGWPSKGDNSWETLENLQLYWETVCAWSAKQNMSMWMSEAFDNPWKNWIPNAAHYGWWKLTNNSAANRLDGYQAKIQVAQPKEEPVPTGPPTEHSRTTNAPHQGKSNSTQPVANPVDGQTKIVHAQTKEESRSKSASGGGSTGPCHKVLLGILFVVTGARLV